MITCKSCW